MSGSQGSLQASRVDHEFDVTTGQEKLLCFAARPKVAKEARKAPSTSHVNNDRSQRVCASL